MHVTVRAFGCWHPILPGGRDCEELQIPEGSSVRELLELARVKDSDIILIAVNGTQVDERYVLQERDQVAIFCPVGGG